MPTLGEIRAAAVLSGFQITEQAAVLIKVTLDAIAEDPHPNWKSKKPGSATPDFQEIIEAQAQLLAQVPKFLKSVQEAEKVTNRPINTFDILHSLSTALNTWCPFDK
jgi:hypothetical protein